MRSECIFSALPHLTMGSCHSVMYMYIYIYIYICIYTYIYIQSISSPFTDAQYVFALCFVTCPFHNPTCLFVRKNILDKTRFCVCVLLHAGFTEAQYVLLVPVQHWNVAGHHPSQVTCKHLNFVFDIRILVFLQHVTIGGHHPFEVTCKSPAGSNETLSLERRRKHSEEGAGIFLLKNVFSYERMCFLTMHWWGVSACPSHVPVMSLSRHTVSLRLLPLQPPQERADPHSVTFHLSFLPCEGALEAHVWYLTILAIDFASPSQRRIQLVKVKKNSLSNIFYISARVVLDYFGHRLRLPVAEAHPVGKSKHCALNLCPRPWTLNPKPIWPSSETSPPRREVHRVGGEFMYVCMFVSM